MKNERKVPSSVCDPAALFQQQMYKAAFAGCKRPSIIKSFFRKIKYGFQRLEILKREFDDLLYAAIEKLKQKHKKKRGK